MNNKSIISIKIQKIPMKIRAIKFHFCLTKIYSYVCNNILAIIHINTINSSILMLMAN